MSKILERSAAAFGCSLDDSRILMQQAKCETHAPRSIVLRQGDRHDVILVLFGHARAVLVTADGRAYRIGDYSTGDLFGLLDDSIVRQSEVSAVQITEIARLQPRTFFALADRYHCVALTLSRSLLRQMSQLSDLLGARVALSAVGRVYAEIARLAVEAADHRIDPFPAVTEIAVRAQTTRETASRAISALERRKIIERQDQLVFVVSLGRLRDLII